MPLAVVACAAGPGIARVLEDAGAVVVAERSRPAGLGRPAARRRPRRPGPRAVVLLPGDRDTLMAAEVAAQAASGEGVDVHVVPARTTVQALAALAVLDPARSVHANVVAMTGAAVSTRHGAVSVATKQALTWAGVCKPGDVLGVVDGDVAFLDTDDRGRRPARCSSRLLSAGGELVTLVLGADAEPGLGERVAAPSSATGPRSRSSSSTAASPSTRCSSGWSEWGCSEWRPSRASSRRSSRPRPRSSPTRAASTPSATSWPSGRGATAPARATWARVVPGELLVGVAEVKSASTRPMRQRKGTMLNVVITDGRHDIDITFFKAWGHERALVPGARGIFAGTVGTYNGRLQLTHPGYTMLDDFDAGERKALIPIYRSVGSLHTWTVTESVRRVLDVLDDVPDALPADVREARRLVSRTEALRGIHTPDSMAEVEEARRRLRYEEAFVLQVTLAQRRRTAAGQVTTPRPARAGGILEAFDARLPFELTAGQREVGATVAEEMGRDVPMHRLLQGEVGSGKTVVALRAMLAAVDAGGQAALLAPTEVLAAQHHRTITAMLGDLAQGGMLGGAEHATRVVAAHGQPVDGRAAPHPARRRERRRGHRRRHARAAPGDRRLLRPRPGRRRRAAPLRRRAAGCVARQGNRAAARARHDRDADPAHRRDDRVRRPRDVDPARAAGRPGADHDARRARGPARLDGAHLAAGRRGGAGRAPGLRRVPPHR